MEIIMLNIKVTYSKSKAKKGWKPWIVDARYALPGGTQKTFASKEEAERYLQRLNAEHGTSSEAWKWTFDELRTEYLKKVRRKVDTGKRSESYYTDCDRYTKGFNECLVNDQPVASMRVADLTKGHVENIIVPQIGQDRSDRTVKNYFCKIQKMIDFAITSGCRETDPVRGTEKEGTRPSQAGNKAPLIADDVIARILQAFAPRWQLIAFFAVTTGLRQAEQRSLTWGNVNFDTQKINVVQSFKHRTNHNPKDPKTRHSVRQVPMPDALANALKELYISQGRPNDPDAFVFPTSSGTSIRGQKMWENLQVACAKAGVAPIAWHDLRHYFASNLLRTHKKDLRIVAEQMGHSTVDFTQKRYGHFLPSAEKDKKDVQDSNVSFAHLDNVIDFSAAAGA